MIETLLFFLISRLLVLAHKRSAAAPGVPRRVAAKRDRGHRLGYICACRLREVLDARAISCYELETKFGIDERDARAFRSGHRVPSPEQKLALLHALNAARPHSRRPKLRYEQVFGSSASPQNCTCELRDLLDGHGLTAKLVAAALGVETKDVIAWRVGRGKPSLDQLAQIRALAQTQPVVVQFRDRRPA